MIGPVKFDRARNFTLRMYFWIFFRSTLGLVPQNSSIQSKNIAKIIENLKNSPRAPFWIFKAVFCNLDIFGAELAIIAPRWESHEAEIDPLQVKHTAEKAIKKRITEGLSHRIGQVCARANDCLNPSIAIAIVSRVGQSEKTACSAVSSDAPVASNPLIYISRRANKEPSRAIVALCRAAKCQGWYGRGPDKELTHRRIKVALAEARVAALPKIAHVDLNSFIAEHLAELRADS